MDESDLLGKMHELLIESLRSREQEVFRYLAILVPALGGFAWLLATKNTSIGLFVVGTMGAQFLLLLGALYSLSLGYNFRYITLELAKIESRLCGRDFHSSPMPRGWCLRARKIGVSSSRTRNASRTPSANRRSRVPPFGFAACGNCSSGRWPDWPGFIYIVNPYGRLSLFPVIPLSRNARSRVTCKGSRGRKRANRAKTRKVPENKSKSGFLNRANSRATPGQLARFAKAGALIFVIFGLKGVNFELKKVAPGALYGVADCGVFVAARGNSGPRHAGRELVGGESECAVPGSAFGQRKSYIGIEQEHFAVCPSHALAAFAPDWKALRGGVPVLRCVLDARVNRIEHPAPRFGFIWWIAGFLVGDVCAARRDRAANQPQGPRHRIDFAALAALRASVLNQCRPKRGLTRPGLERHAPAHGELLKDSIGDRHPRDNFGCARVRIAALQRGRRLGTQSLEIAARRARAKLIELWRAPSQEPGHRERIAARRRVLLTPCNLVIRKVARLDSAVKNAGVQAIADWFDFARTDRQAGDLAR
jgi:hypothetical protein